MKKRILKWLFGTENVEEYVDVLGKSADAHRRCIELIDDHLETLNRNKENINTILKLIKICKNHGIDVDEELKQIDNIKE